MELLIILGLVVMFSGLSLLFRLIGFGFRIFWLLFIGAFTLLGYILVGIISLIFPVIAVIILIKLFNKED